MDNNFNSIERLMEFGMGMAVAQQMINTMNYAMTNMAVPGVGTTATPNMTQPQQQNGFYVVIDGAQAGPFSEQELNTIVVNGKLTPDTLVWRRGMDGWTFARKVSEICKLFLLNNISL
ncbi:MAG: DUF4339 domain-containing protein [Muribaculaceae bacterium]|nr:DUF4339 domain-containing protein [Muribaculaceae bacterium]